MRKPATEYNDDLRATFRNYRRRVFAGGDKLFEDRTDHESGPTVFKREHASRNVLVPSGASPLIEDALARSLPATDRHRWFGSMASSQALCQSVFGYLSVTGQLGALEGLEADEGGLAFYAAATGLTLELEHKVTTLGETQRPTSVDAFVNGNRRVAIEVKFGETEFGTCSRPRLRTSDPHYERDHCDGSHTLQRRRATRCSLTSQGIRYWEYIPQLLHWSADVDQMTCSLAFTYQLVRNLLAASVNLDGSVELANAHALIIYDDRNPAFAPGGVADSQWNKAVVALRYPHMLRRVSWQRLVGHIGGMPGLRWLVDELELKYGIVGVV